METVPQASFRMYNIHIIKNILFYECFTERDIKQLTDNKRFGYVTYQDIRSIESYRQKTVLVVKAPPETELQVPQDHIDGEVSINTLNALVVYKK